MAGKPKYTVKQMIDALRATKGMVYLTAQRLGCDVKTIYNYRDRYASVRAEMEQQDGVVDDTAELKLFQAIRNGEPWAIQFRLRTKGRNRGYVERVEQQHSGSVDVIVKGYTTVTPDDWDADKTDSHL